MEETQILKLSVLEHLKAALANAGWSDTDKWVRLGHVQPETSPPAVGIDCPEMDRVPIEVGSIKRAVRGLFEIEVKATDEFQLENLKDDIEAHLDNMRIIDFNTAMPEDPGYNAVTQTVARGLTGETIRGRVSDPDNCKATISFTLETDRPI